MIQTQLKLRLNVTQETLLNSWLFRLTGVWNWAIRKIEHDAQGEVYYSKQRFQNLLAGHGQKIGIPSHTLQGILLMAHSAWSRCFKKTGGKPRLKGIRNKLSSIPFPDPLRSITGNRVTLPGIGSLRFHTQDIPTGKIKCARLVKRASGWYLCLFIDAERAPIASTGRGMIGIDPGFIDLLTLSDGEKIPHSQELQRSLKRLGQAQRGVNRKLTARLHERIKNQRKDRNHKLSLRLVKENAVIVFSKDNTIARCWRTRALPAYTVSRSRFPPFHQDLLGLWVPVWPDRTGRTGSKDVGGCVRRVERLMIATSMPRSTRSWPGSERPSNGTCAMPPDPSRNPPAFAVGRFKV